MLSNVFLASQALGIAVEFCWFLAEQRRGKIRGKQNPSENLLPKHRKGMWEQDLWRGKAKVQQWVTIGGGTGLNLEDSGYF